uniref:Uncharacterized protein n=1 Tax=Anguilla anguilla TaxID=7936 RepID=A0A0E9Y0I5_ANGAN
MAMSQVVTIYNALPEAKKEDCKKFDLKVTLDKEKKGTVYWALNENCSVNKQNFCLNI